MEVKQWFMHSTILKLLLASMLYLLVSLPYLLSTEITHDEPFSLYHAHLPLAEIVERLGHGNNSPLYEIITHFIVFKVHDSLGVVRFFSTIYVCLALFFSSLTVMRLHSKQAAYAFIGVSLFSSYYLNFAHEARGYALFLCCYAASIYFFVSWYMQAEASLTLRRLYMLGFVFFALLAMYVHYMSLIGFFSLAVFMLFQFSIKQLSWQRLREWWWVLPVVVICFYPQLHDFIDNSSKVAKGGTWLGKPSVEDLYNLMWKFINSPVATVMALLLMVYVIVSSKLFTHKGVQFLLFMFLFPMLFVFALSFKVPLFHDRYLIFISTCFYSLVSVSVVECWKKHANLFRFAAVLVCMVYVFSFRIQGKPSDQLNKALLASDQAHAAYVVAPVWYCYNFFYYYQEGYYFKHLYDYTHTTPKDVFFDYNLATFDYSKLSAYREINVLQSHDAAQLALPGIMEKLESLHYHLIKKLSVSETCMMYQFVK